MPPRFPCGPFPGPPAPYGPAPQWGYPCPGGPVGNDPQNPYTPRATDAAVRGVYTTIPASYVTAPFIQAANMLVNAVCVPPNLYYNDQLTQIEIWLAAHLVAMDKLKAVEEQAGSARRRYMDKGVMGLGLQLTNYGQMAMMLDNYSLLASLNNFQKTATQRTASIGWAGIPNWQRPVWWPDSAPWLW